MKVAYTRRAQSDLGEIHAHVTAQDPAMAKAMVADIATHCAALAHNPRLNPTTDVPNVRRMPLASYPFTVYYRIDSRQECVFIARIVRSNRVRNLRKVPS
jgi:plasmid stabilization system protein ParE